MEKVALAAASAIGDVHSIRSRSPRQQYGVNSHLSPRADRDPLDRSRDTGFGYNRSICGSAHSRGSSRYQYVPSPAVNAMDAADMGKVYAADA